MIKMRYEELAGRDFQAAISKLNKVPMRDPAAFRIRHIVKAIQNEFVTLDALRQKELFSPFAKGGSPQPPQGKSLEMGLPFDIIEGKEEAAKKAMANFGEREFTIDQKRLTGEFLFSVSEWSAAELAVLDPLIVELAQA